MDSWPWARRRRRPPKEGLAVLMELLAGVCHPARLLRLRRRFHAVQMAEGGAIFETFIASSWPMPTSHAMPFSRRRGSFAAACRPGPDHSRKIGRMPSAWSACSAPLRRRAG